MDYAGGARMRVVELGYQIPAETYKINRTTLVEYADAGGDKNPIHQDEAIAKSVGLPDVIAHGMLTMALAGSYVTKWAGSAAAVTEISSRFTKPVVVPAGVDVEITISAVIDEVSARQVRLEITAECAGVKVLGMAKATVSLL
jgi:acyl dehydratase